jgi:hypothetical protein
MSLLPKAAGQTCATAGDVAGPSSSAALPFCTLDSSPRGSSDAELVAAQILFGRSPRRAHRPSYRDAATAKAAELASLPTPHATALQDDLGQQAWTTDHQTSGRLFPPNTPPRN